MILEASRLERLRRAEVALVGSRHAAAATMASHLKRTIPAGTRVLVATSGGSDSMGLLALSIALHDRRRPAVIDPVAAHVDHALRTESGEEASFVAEACKRLRVPVIGRRLEWPDRTSRVGSEAARKARWNALEEMAAEVEAHAILTAHHADDQAETVLMRLARGTGIDGLAGIPERRPLQSGRLILRPLLGIPRSALRELVSEAGLPFIEDPTNADTSRPRERLRHEVIPALEEIHPGVTAHLAALARECSAREAGPHRPDFDLERPIQRSACRDFDEDGLATRLRTSAARLSDVTSIPRVVWTNAASMIQDQEPRPRRLPLGRSLELLVHRETAIIHASEGTPK